MAEERPDARARTLRTLLASCASGSRAVVLSSVLAELVAVQRPVGPALSAGMHAAVVLACACLLAATLSVPVALAVPVRALLGPRLQAGAGAAAAKVALVLLLAAPLLWVGFGRVLAARRAPFDFPAELDAALALGLVLAVCVGVAAAAFAVTCIPSRFRDAAWPLPLALAAFAFACFELGGVQLPSIHAYPLIVPSLLLGLLLAWLSGATLPFAPRAFEAPAFVVAALAGLALVPSSGATLRGALLARSEVSAALLRRIGGTFDLDGDGYWPAFVGGFDCDDADADIHPFAPDAPGNGRDEDCSGRDAVQSPLRLGLAEPAAGRPDLLLITIDALSARHLGLYGYARRTSPALDRFAREAVVFTHAYTVTPSTDFALSALLGGRYASTLLQLGPDGHRNVRLRATLPGLLARGGYDTTCVEAVANETPTLGCQHAPAVIARAGAIAELSVSVTQLELVHDALAKPADKPRFVWTHLLDPHAAYLPRDPTHPGSAIERYDYEIASVDALLGRLIEALRSRGALEHTAVVITADHGEQLDGGAVGHGPLLRDDLLHVPLLIRLPGAAAHAGRVDAAVSLIDLAPTLLELAAMEVQPRDALHGRSLVPLLRGRARPGPDRAVLAEVFHGPRKQLAVIERDHKLVVDVDLGVSALYDLARDPGETRDLAAAQPAEARRLLGRMLELRRGLDLVR